MALLHRHERSQPVSPAGIRRIPRQQDESLSGNAAAGGARQIVAEDRRVCLGRPAVARISRTGFNPLTSALAAVLRQPLPGRARVRGVSPPGLIKTRIFPIYLPQPAPYPVSP